jgi:hypothetical protein
MLTVYAVLLTALGVLTWYAGRRARKAEARLQKAEGVLDVKQAALSQAVTVEADIGLQHPNAREVARRQSAVARLEADEAAARYRKTLAGLCAWSARNERLCRWRLGLRSLRGRSLPYTFGVLDAVGVLSLLDAYLGLDNVKALAAALARLAWHKWAG